MHRTLQLLFVLVCLAINKTWLRTFEVMFRNNVRRQIARIYLDKEKYNGMFVTITHPRNSQRWSRRVCKLNTEKRRGQTGGGSKGGISTGTVGQDCFCATTRATRFLRATTVRLITSNRMPGPEPSRWTPPVPVARRQGGKAVNLEIQKSKKPIATYHLKKLKIRSLEKNCVK